MKSDVDRYNLRSLLDLVRKGRVGPNFATKTWGVDLEEVKTCAQDDVDFKAMADQMAKKFEKDVIDSIVDNIFGGTSTEKEYYRQFQGMPYTSAPPPDPARSRVGGIFGGNRYRRNDVNVCEDCGATTTRDLCYTCEGKRASSARPISVVSVTPVTPPPPDP